MDGILALVLIAIIVFCVNRVANEFRVLSSSNGELKQV